MVLYKPTRPVSVLRYIFQNKDQELFSKFRLPSTWLPQPTYSNRLEDYLEATLTEIASLPIRNAKSNITKAELNALKAIRNDRSLVVKPFDKGRGIAILNRSDYIAEIERQLQSHYYERLPGDLTPETVKLVQTTLQDMFHKDEIDEQTFEYLSPRNHKIRTPVLYVLPKIHKAPPANSKFAGRPIISGNGSPTEKISEFVYYFLLLIVLQQST